MLNFYILFRKDGEERRSRSAAVTASGGRDVNAEFPYLVFAFPVFPVTSPPLPL